MLKGERLSFDDESRVLYDAVAPTFPESHFQAILNRLEKRFPGSGPLVGVARGGRLSGQRRDDADRGGSG